MLLRVTGVSKRYGAVQAPDRVDLLPAEGQVMALAGENDSGKSTLSKIISGGVVPDEGAIELDGRPASFADPRAALDAGIRLVSREPPLVPYLSVAENVMLSRIGRPAWSAAAS